MLEYSLLVGGVAVAAMLGAQTVGGALSSMIEEAAYQVQDNEQVGGTCPNGWDLVDNTVTKKNGQDVDANGDGKICIKDIPGNGKGNTNANSNVKDNNGGPG